MIIDGHTHLRVGDDLPLAEFSRVEPTIEWMDRAGVDKICALVAFREDRFTREKLRELKPFRERLLLFAWLDPRRPEAPQVLRYCLDELGFTGLKLHPLEQHYAIDAPGLLDPLMEVCSERRLHTIIHCTSGVPGCTPEKLELLAKRYPQATFQLAHTGAVYAGNPAIAVAARTPNLYLDTGIASTNCIRRAVLAVPEQVIMGCDWPSYSFEQEILKCRTACELAGRPEYLSALTGGNIARVLGLQEERKA